MPYKVRKRDCNQEDGDEGKYVIVKVKRSGKEEKKSCHTTKQLAQAATRAPYASEYGESVMKITAGDLRSIIKEELALLNEQSVPLDMVERLNTAMSSIAEYVMDKYEEDDAGEGISATESILQDEIAGFIKSLIEASDNDPDTDNDRDLDSSEIRRMIKTIGDDLEEETA